MRTAAIKLDTVWSVALLSSIVSLLSAVGISNGSLFYVAIIQHLRVSHEAAAWTGSASSVAAHVAGLFVVLLELRFSLFQVTLMGATLLWIGFVSSAFAPSIGWITITLGVIHGSGIGIVFVALSVYIAAFFDKYRAAASGLKFAGQAAAGLIFPPAITALLRTYGFTGAVLLFGGVCMNATPFVMLLGNPPVLTAKDTNRAPFSRIKNVAASCLNCFSSSKSAVNQPAYNKEVKSSVSFFTSKSESKPQTTEGTSTQTTSLGTESSQPRAEFAVDIDLKTAGATEAENAAAAPSPLSNRRKSVHDVWEPLRKPIFYALVPGLICSEYCEMASQTTIVDYSMDKGWDINDATSLVICLAVGSFVGRLLLPLLADLKFVTRTSLMSACYIGYAAAFLAMPHVNSFHGVILLCVVSGATVGCAQSLKPVVMADYLGAQLIAPCSGMAGIIMLPLVLGNPAIIGLFRDQMGSYDNYYRLVAAICLVVAGTLMAIVGYEKYNVKNAASDAKQNEHAVA
ncbi:monocarboxylate transporter 9-like [Haemaphysalis longicornis]